MGLVRRGETFSFLQFLVIDNSPLGSSSVRLRGGSYADPV